MNPVLCVQKTPLSLVTKLHLAYGTEYLLSKALPGARGGQYIGNHPL